jgi:type I restriction enzyme S subunit
MVRLGDFVGINPQKSEARKLLNPDDPVSFLPMEDLGVRCGEVTPIKQRRFGDVQSSYTYFRDGDVLLAKITPCFENGKLGIARNLVNGVGFGSSEYLVIRPTDLLLSEYVYHAISRNEFIDQGQRVMTGSVGHKRVPKDYVSELQIPLPPLDEQKRIVAKLDLALQEIDRLNNNLEQQLSQLTDFDSTMLSEMLGNPRQTPEPAVTTKWPSVLLGSMIALEYGKPLAQSDRSSNGTVPVYGANGVKTYTNEAYFSQPSIIVGRKGSAGELHFAPEPFWPLDVTYFVTHDSAITDINYLFYALTSLGLPSLARGVKPGINRNDVYDLLIPLPPLDEQKRIVGALDGASLAIASLRSNILERQKSTSELQSSILAAAFAGAL